jgi:hypothetical protein
MTGALLLLSALVLPPSANAIRVSSGGWPSPANVEKGVSLAEGERIWWWSAECAPQRVEGEAPTNCAAVRPTTITVVDERQRPLGGVKLIWGTGEQLTDVPDSMLPSGVTDEHGTATLALPNDSAVYVRAAGPQYATWWQTVPASARSARMRATRAFSPRTTLVSRAGDVGRALLQVELPTITTATGARPSWAVSDDGAFTLPALPAVSLTLIVNTDAFAPVVMSVRSDDLPKTIELVPGSAATGRLIDSKRAPVEGAEVTAGFKLPGFQRGLMRYARSDASGRYVLRGIPSGPAQLKVTKTGYATSLQPIDASADVAVADVVLTGSRVAPVKVVDTRGRPIAGASVRSKNGPAAVTGADGVAKLAGVSVDEETLLTVEAKRFHSAQVALPVAVRQEFVVTLASGVRVAASLVNVQTGQPAGPGTVLVMNNGARMIAKFDADGTIDIGGLDAGRLSLEIRASGMAPQPIAERAVAENEAWDLGTLRLDPGATVTGKLVDRESSDSVADATVRVMRRREHGPVVAFVMRDWAEGRSRDDGTFLVSGLSNGPQVALIEAAGYASRVMTVNSDDDEPAAADVGTVALDRGRELVIRCSPVARCGSAARVLLAGADYPWAAVSGSMADGNSRVSPVAPGSAVLRLVDGQHVVHERTVEISTSPQTNITIELPTTDVSGVVLAGGRPRRGGRVTLERHNGGREEFTVFIHNRSAEGQSLGTQLASEMPTILVSNVDDSGRFAFKDIEPGGYRATYRRDGSASEPTSVNIPDGRDYQFTIEVPATELRGRVTDESSNAAPWVAIKVRDSAGRTHSAQTDAEGSFGLVGVSAGAAVVEAAGRDGEGSASVQIESDRATTIDVVLKKAKSPELVATVFAPSGQPLAGALVFVHGPDVFRVATSDSEGRVTVRMRQQAQVNVSAFHGTHGWAWSPLTNAGRDSAPVKLQMSAETGSIVVESATAGAVAMQAPFGTPVHELFSLAGMATTVGAGQQVRYSRLPPGGYRVGVGMGVGMLNANVEVTRGKDSVVRVP